jgi:hypothetical protein
MKFELSLDEKKRQSSLLSIDIVREPLGGAIRKLK